jgi:hypothetical protein
MARPTCTWTAQQRMNLHEAELISIQARQKAKWVIWRMQFLSKNGVMKWGENIGFLRRQIPVCRPDEFLEYFPV